MRPWVTHRFRQIQLTGALPYLGVFLFAILVYSYTLTFDFVGYDDDQLLLENTLIHHLSWHSLWHIFTEPVRFTFTPIRFLSHMVDFSLWGTKPWGHHLSNVLIHGLNTVGVFCLLSALLRTRKTAAWGALLFAIHPVGVESVAWISARKDLLYTLFLLLSAFSVMRFRQAKTFHPGFWAIVFFIASLLSKFSAILFVIPLAALLVGTSAPRRTRWGLALVAVASTLLIGGVNVALFYQGQPPNETSVLFRMMIAAKAITVHLANLIVPVSLSPFQNIVQPRYQFTIENLGYMAVSVALLLALIFTYKNFRQLFWLLLILLLPLAPVVLAGQSAPLAANRYLYLPSVGFAGLLAILLTRRSRLGFGLLVLILSIYLPLSYEAAHKWKNAEQLMRLSLAEHPNNPRVLELIAAVLRENPDLDKPFTVSVEGLRRNPRLGYATLMIGHVFHLLGEKHLRDLMIDSLQLKVTDGRQREIYENYLGESLFASRTYPLPHELDLALHGRFVQAGRLLGAFLVLWKLHQQTPSNSRIALQLAKFCAYMGLGPIADSVLRAFPSLPTVPEEALLFHQTKMMRAYSHSDRMLAQQHAEAVLTQDPKDSTAKAILDKLRTFDTTQ